MIIQLAAIHAHGLLEPVELERFTERTRATIDFLARGSNISMAAVNWAAMNAVVWQFPGTS
jgi:hypothetical protein